MWAIEKCARRRRKVELKAENTNATFHKDLTKTLVVTVIISARLRTKTARAECVSCTGGRKGAQAVQTVCPTCSISLPSSAQRTIKQHLLRTITSDLQSNQSFVNDTTSRTQVHRSFLVSSFVHEGASIVGKDGVKLFQHPWNCVHWQRHLIYVTCLDGSQLAKETLLTRYVLCEDSLV
jgi:hypothetical protein